MNFDGDAGESGAEPVRRGAEVDVHAQLAQTEQDRRGFRWSEPAQSGGRRPGHRIQQRQRHQEPDRQSRIALRAGIAAGGSRPAVVRRQQLAGSQKSTNFRSNWFSFDFHSFSLISFDFHLILVSFNWFSFDIHSF